MKMTTADRVAQLTTPALRTELLRLRPHRWTQDQVNRMGRRELLDLVIEASTTAPTWAEDGDETDMDL